MNWKTKLRSASFWTAIGAAIVIMLRAFGVEMGDGTTEAVINAVCGILVVFGIFNDNGSAIETIDKITDLADEIIDLSDEVVGTKEDVEKEKNAEEKKDVEAEDTSKSDEAK